MEWRFAFLLTLDEMKKRTDGGQRKKREDKDSYDTMDVDGEQHKKVVAGRLFILVVVVVVVVV